MRHQEQSELVPLSPDELTTRQTNQQFRELGTDVSALMGIMKDCGDMVKVQGNILENAENHAVSAEQNVEDGVEQIKEAEQLQKKTSCCGIKFAALMILIGLIATTLVIKSFVGMPVLIALCVAIIALVLINILIWSVASCYTKPADEQKSQVSSPMLFSETINKDIAEEVEVELPTYRSCCGLFC
jgi:hypothetical protein